MHQPVFYKFKTATVAEPCILVIDDEPSVRQSIARFLEEFGWKAPTAKNAESSLEVFSEIKPQVVIVDLQLSSGMNGLDLLAKIQDKWPEIQVIVISGIGNMKDVITALRLGAWDYLEKPIADMTVLGHTVAKALERYGLITENAAYAEKIAKNLQVLEEDQKAGRSVQMRLLPTHFVRYGNYLFNHELRPLLYLSGDFVEYFPIDDNKVGLYLADVSGHGVSSAFITVLLRSLIAQAYSRYQIEKDLTICRPEIIMEELSYEIHTAKLGKYMTMIYGIIDLETHEFTYGIAGHYPSPILVDASGHARYLPGQGFPIGIMRNTAYEANKVQIPEGGHLLLFSDGIMDYMLPGYETAIKEQQLLKIINNSKADISAILKQAGQNAEQLDDITVLTVSRLHKHLTSD